MNAFNRVCMTLFALLLVALGVTAFLVVGSVLSPSSVSVGCPVLGAHHRALATLGGDERALGFVISAAVALLGLVLFFVELFPRRGSSVFLVDASDLGDMTVEREGVCRMAERVALSIEGVMGARAVMDAKDEQVSCRCVVSVHSDAPVKSISEEVQKLIRESVARQVGIELHQVEVKARITNDPKPELPRVVD